MLYEAARLTSWKDFGEWRWLIGFLTFGLVFLTAGTVAGGAAGFVLGGSVSPPNAVMAPRLPGPPAAELAAYRRLHAEVLATQRAERHHLRGQETYDDEVIRALEAQVDAAAQALAFFGVASLRQNSALASARQ